MKLKGMNGHLEDYKTKWLLETNLEKKSERLKQI